LKTEWKRRNLLGAKRNFIKEEKFNKGLIKKNLDLIYLLKRTFIFFQRENKEKPLQHIETS